MEKQPKLLFFTDNDSGRDVEILLPIRYFAEHILNCQVKHAFIYDISAVYREKPDVVVLPNNVGSHYYFYISKYAYEQGIPVFAMTSEGNFRTDGSFNYWGYNKDKIFHQEYVCLWSERTAEFLKKDLPEISDKIVVTGGTGFDRYKILKFEQRDSYLLKKGVKRKYDKVVGYAGWAFGKLSNKQGVDELLYYFKNDTERLTWLERQRQLVEDALRYVIEKNPEILFILKKHPNENNPSIIKEGLNEMNQLVGYENVLYITEEESVHQSISISDLWMAFESTTALEAWLIGKETIFINPDPNFNRDPNYKGCVLVNSGEELQKRIEEFYSAGTLKDFYTVDKISAREKIIKDTIGFADGLNHVRAGIYLNNILKSLPERKQKIIRKINLKYFTMSFLLYAGRHFYNRELFSRLPRFKKTVWVFERYRLTKIGTTYEAYSLDFSDFYKKQNIHTRFQSGSLFKELY